MKLYILICMLFIATYALSQCGTSPNDCDSDGITNDIDLDDDNDGILDTTENESQIKPAGYAVAITAEYSVLNENRILGAPNNQYGNFNNPNDSVVIDFGYILPANLTLNIRARNDNTVSKTIDVAESNSDGSVLNQNVTITISSTSYQDYSYTLSSPSRYLRIKRVGNSNGSIQIDSVEHAAFDNSDVDEDGIPNDQDLDSDNDGCPDALEGGDDVLSSNLNADTSISGAIDAEGVPDLVNPGGSADTDNAQGQAQGTAYDKQKQFIDCCTVKPPITGTELSTHLGISSLSRDTDGSMISNTKNAFLKLESESLGLVITRISETNPDEAIDLPIAHPEEGMLIWNTTKQCLMFYTLDNNGNGKWACAKNKCNP